MIICRDGSVSLSELETFLWPPRVISSYANTADHGASAPDQDDLEFGVLLVQLRTVRYENYCFITCGI